MGITLHQDGDREYYRITKAWNGKEIQKYVRIGRNRDTALRKAKQVEESLAQRQRVALVRKRMDGAGILHSNGRITGLQMLFRTRAERCPWLEFKVRVKEPGLPVRFRTVSISAHGFAAAFELAVQGICELRDIPQQSPLHQRMLETRAQYAQDVRKQLEKCQTESLAGRDRIMDDLTQGEWGRVDDDVANMDARLETKKQPADEIMPNYHDYELALKAARSQFIASKPALRG